MLFQFKAPGYRAFQVCFPFGVLPQTATCAVTQLQDREFSQIVSVNVDVEHFDPSKNSPDPGSKQWLLAQALTGGENYSADPTDSQTQALRNRLVEERRDTTKGIDSSEGDELPEDAFHRKDASSMFLIEQREQSLKEKSDKFERWNKCLSFQMNQRVIEIR